VLTILSTESLRIRGPLLELNKMCNESVEIALPKDKKMKFNENDVIYIPAHSIHMDPEHYENPEQFIPERFSAENGGAKAYMDRGVFFPFGLGPRICVGNRFAVAQSKCAIAALIRNFEITVNPKSPKEFINHPQALVASMTGCYLDFKAYNYDSLK